MLQTHISFKNYLHISNCLEQTKQIVMTPPPPKIIVINILICAFILFDNVVNKNHIFFSFSSVKQSFVFRRIQHFTSSELKYNSYLVVVLYAAHNSLFKIFHKCRLFTTLSWKSSAIKDLKYFSIKFIMKINFMQLNHDIHNIIR